jgi:hypothetical protein
MPVQCVRNLGPWFDCNNCGICHDVNRFCARVYYDIYRIVSFGRNTQDLDIACFHHNYITRIIANALLCGIPVKVSKPIQRA